MIRALAVGLLGLVVAFAGAVVCVALPVDPWAAALLGGVLVVAGGSAAVWSVGA